MPLIALMGPLSAKDHLLAIQGQRLNRRRPLARSMVFLSSGRASIHERHDGAIDSAASCDASDSYDFRPAHPFGKFPVTGVKDSAGQAVTAYASFPSSHPYPHPISKAFVLSATAFTGLHFFPGESIPPFGPSLRG